jgi:hypothetical protein
MAVRIMIWEDYFNKDLVPHNTSCASECRAFDRLRGLACTWRDKGDCCTIAQKTTPIPAQCTRPAYKPIILAVLATDFYKCVAGVLLATTRLESGGCFWLG